MKIEVIIDFRSERAAFLSDALVKIVFESADSCLDFLFLSVSTAVTVIQVDMLFLFVSFKQYAFHTRSVDIIPVDVMNSFALKCPLIFSMIPG